MLYYQSSLARYSVVWNTKYPNNRRAFILPRNIENKEIITMVWVKWERTGCKSVAHVHLYQGRKIEITWPREETSTTHAKKKISGGRLKDGPPSHLEYAPKSSKVSTCLSGCCVEFLPPRRTDKVLSRLRHVQLHSEAKVPLQKTSTWVSSFM